MKAIKLPRNLKKALKKSLLRRIDPAWKSNDIKIKDVRNNWHNGQKEVTAYTLGY